MTKNIIVNCTEEEINIKLAQHGFPIDLKKKYLKLLEFVKHMASIESNIYPVCFSIDAEKLLEEIGEAE